MDTRNIIRNRIQAKRLVLFEGLDYGTITPTNIDFFVEVKDVGYMVGEFKSAPSKMPIGQRLAIERIIDALAASGKDAVGFVAEAPPGDDDYYAIDCPITQLRYQGRWIGAKPNRLGAVWLTWIDHIDGVLKENARIRVQ